MKKTIIIMIALIVPLIVLSQSALAQNILEVSVNIDPEDKVTLNDIRVAPGTEDQIDISERPYRLELSYGSPIYSTYFPVPKKILTDPPSEADSVMIVRKIPYLGNNGYVTIFKFDNMLYNFNLSRLCIEDGVCKGFENYLSCPSDCKLSNKDRVCVAEADRTCDPDCIGEIDPDCVKQPEPEVVPEELPPEEEEQGQDWDTMLIFYGSILFVIGILILFYNSIKKQEK